MNWPMKPAPLPDWVELLAERIQAYEARIASLGSARPRPPRVLRLLMEAHGMKQADLADIGSQGVVSEILNGKRDLKRGKLPGWRRCFTSARQRSSKHTQAKLRLRIDASECSPRRVWVGGFMPAVPVGAGRPDGLDAGKAQCWCLGQAGDPGPVGQRAALAQQLGRQVGAAIHRQTSLPVRH